MGERRERRVAVMGGGGGDTVLTVTTNHKLLNIDDPAIIFTDLPRVYLVTLVLAA